jgi:hypothetical protein
MPNPTALAATTILSLSGFKRFRRASPASVLFAACCQRCAVSVGFLFSGAVRSVLRCIWARVHLLLGLTLRSTRTGATRQPVSLGVRHMKKMHMDTYEKLEKLGLCRAWFIWKFVDADFINAEYELAESQRQFDEHTRISFYAKFFKDRENQWVSNGDIQKYMYLVFHELDLGLKSWALSFIVECENLSRKQLIRLAEHELVKSSEKHTFFIQRNIDNFAVRPNIALNPDGFAAG